MSKYQRMTQNELCEAREKIWLSLKNVLSDKVMNKISELQEIDHQQMNRTYNFTLKERS